MIQFEWKLYKIAYYFFWINLSNLIIKSYYKILKF